VRTPCYLVVLLFIHYIVKYTKTAQCFTVQVHGETLSSCFSFLSFFKLFFFFKLVPGLTG
jgi:hypothetical protein